MVLEDRTGCSGGGRDRETRRGYKEGWWRANVPFVDIGAGYITGFTL